jgi:hypothetical protein
MKYKLVNQKIINHFMSMRKEASINSNITRQ